MKRGRYKCPTCGGYDITIPATFFGYLFQNDKGDFTTELSEKPPKRDDHYFCDCGSEGDLSQLILEDVK